MDAENNYRIIKSWDDARGDWLFCLEIDNNTGKGWERTVYSGDGNWAAREKEHYECEIIDLDEVDE